MPITPPKCQMSKKTMTFSPQADMEDMADLADMRHLLMERVQGVMATCCEYRNSLERYSYLYVDDRREFMRQFLLYGHILSNHETEGYADESVPESPPTLESFREQVDRYVWPLTQNNTFTEIYSDCELCVQGWCQF